MLTQFDKLCQIKNGIKNKGFDLQRCIQRHKSPLTALKTLVFHDRDGYQKRYARYAVAYAAGKTIDPEKLSRAGIGFMPIGKKGHCLEYYTQPNADKDWETTYGVSDWKPKSWCDSYGIQIYTGEPSGYLTSLDFEYAIIRDHPQHFLDTLSRLCELTENPLLVISKSGGLRFECRTPGYIHPKTDQRYVATWKNHHEHQELYLEIFGEKGLSRYDARYELYTGSLLNIPVIDHHALFEVLKDLQEQIGEPCPERHTAKPKPTQTPEKRQKAGNATSVKIIDDLPEGIVWRERKDGSFESVRGDYRCPRTKHTNSHGAAQYYRQTNGQIDAFCHNCKKPWIVKEADTLEKLIAKAPSIEVRETPAFPYFSEEERTVVDKVLGISPDAGWHEGVPAFATRYENLYPLTGEFARNGQPDAVEKRRVWSTQFGTCEKCGDLTADWVDRYLLTAGRYCNTCHSDTPIGSYLQWELARKLPNSIISEHQGYLGDDPEFEDFRLWAPEMLTHLGAGMSTGKSTEIYKAIVSLAIQKLGVGIIASPRISLSRFLAHQLRKRHGQTAWGLWHEGSGSSEQFIGTYGAIVCLPSLGRVVSAAYASGLDASDLYVAIDEVDFGYSLLSLTVHQAAAVKKCLLDIFLASGLVVSGQTESTLALEAFAAELGCEHVQAFYNTAPRADGIVELRKYPDVEGKNALVLAGSMESIEIALGKGYNVYAFCSLRRDAEIIAERFAEYAPVCYNAYTKGDARCDTVLKNQCLPEGSRLFIGTSAAGVGISILDPKAKTVIVGGLNHGSRGASMVVQKGFRDRGRRGIEFHYTDYNSALPVRPRETEHVSLFHERTKQLENRYAHLSEDAIKKVARSLALSTLADHQLQAFVSYHLGKVGNMQVVETNALPIADADVEWVTEQRRASVKKERESKCELAVEYLNDRNLYTSHEIRVKSNRGRLTQAEQIAHEYVNGLACAVGWNDTINREIANPFDACLNDEDIGVAIALAIQNIDPERLEKLRRGYLAVHYPKWVTAVFQKELEAAHSDTLNAGGGRELTAIRDDRFLGVVLKALLNRLKDETFNSDANLAAAIREVLDTVSEGQTLFGRIKQGGLGAQAYQRARFLNIGDDAFVISWARIFIKEYYPATLSKRGSRYSLVHDKKIELILASFKCWLSKRVDGEVPELATYFEELDPQVELKQQARARRKEGATFKIISEELGEPQTNIRRWCRGIKPEKETVQGKAAKNRAEKEARIQKARARKKEGATLEDIKAEFNISLTTAHRWCRDIKSD